MIYVSVSWTKYNCNLLLFPWNNVNWCNSRKILWDESIKTITTTILVCRQDWLGYFSPWLLVRNPPYLPRKKTYHFHLKGIGHVILYATTCDTVNVNKLFPWHFGNTPLSWYVQGVSMDHFIAIFTICTILGDIVTQLVLNLSDRPLIHKVVY